jgi:ABC-2 type transport system permease protein
VTRYLAYLDACRAIVRRDAMVFMSYRSAAIGQVFSILFSLVLFYYVSRLVQVEAFGSPDGYFAFVVVGMVIFQVLQSTLELSAKIRAELLAGTFERVVVSPLGAVGGIVAMIVFPFLLALVMALVTLVMGSVLFGIAIQWDTAGLAVPVAAIGSLSFTAVGLLFVAVVLLVKQVGSGVGFVTAGIAIISGLYFPVSLLPDWIQWTANIQPFTPAVDLLRHLLIGLPMRGSPWTAVLKLVLFAVVLLPAALWAVRASVLRARRTGTIIEY